MNRTLKLISTMALAVLVIIMVSQVAIAQPPPPPPPSTTTGPPIPMDGGLGVLLVLFGALGVKKLAQEEEEE